MCDGYLITGAMFVHLIAANIVNDDEVLFKITFPFELTIALGTRKAGRNPAFVLQVNSKCALTLVRPLTLAALEKTFLGCCVVGAVF